jgi:hypothetical protein
MLNIFRDKRQQRREVIRIMAGREAVVPSCPSGTGDLFKLKNVETKFNSHLLVNFTEFDQISGDEIYLKRLKPNAIAESSFITTTTDSIISAFNYR